MKSVDDLFGLIKEQYERGEKVVCHPNGFLELSLSPIKEWDDEGFRFHVWSDTLKPRRDSAYEIHDHIFDLESWVLCGTLENIYYDIQHNKNGEYLIFEAGYDETKPTSDRISILNKKSIIISAPSRYTLPKYKFHSTKSIKPLTATLVYKSNTDSSKMPRILGALEYDRTMMAVNREIDQIFSWNIIKLVEHEVRASGLKSLEFPYVA